MTSIIYTLNFCRCPTAVQFSDNEEDEELEVVKSPKRSKKKDKRDKINHSIASLNSNYRESSSETDSTGRVSP